MSSARGEQQKRRQGKPLSRLRLRRGHCNIDRLKPCLQFDESDLNQDQNLSCTRYEEGDLSSLVNTNPALEFQEQPDLVAASALAHEDHAKALRTVDGMFEPSYLFMAALTEHVCMLYGGDEDALNSLFHVVWQKLVEMRVVSHSYTVDQLNRFRHVYRSPIEFLLLSAKEHVLKNFQVILHPSLNCGDKARLLLQPQISNFRLPSWNFEYLFDSTRYLNEFVEVEQIGKGGFGFVYKARNRLDNNEYAVKKVVFPKNFTQNKIAKIMREVTLLAKLRHDNVVGYHSAWLECGYHPSSSSSSETSGSSHKSFSNGLGANGVSSIIKFNNIVRDDGYDDSHVVFNDENSQKYNVLQHRASAEKNQAKCLVCESGSSSSDYSRSHMVETTTHNFKRANEQHAKKDFATSNEDEIETANSITVSGEVNEVACTLKAGLDDEAVELPPILRIRHKSKSHDSMQNQGTKDKLLPVAVGFHRSISLQTEPSAKLNVWKRQWSDSPTLDRVRVILFIQMQLCTRTLKDALLLRNGNLMATCDNYRVLDNRRLLSIFQQIIKGVSYIHDQGLVHRDLKPSNVFLQDDDHVLIGDFGLARNDMFQRASPSKRSYSLPSDMLTTDVGTSLYASPEQLSNIDYNYKSDIFSLGIILFEMFQPFNTEMERIKTLTNVRQGNIPPEFSDKWPKLAHHIKSMVNEDPIRRPSADELLHSELFISKDQIIQSLKAKVNHLQDVNRKKDVVIAAKNSQIAVLRGKLGASAKENDQKIRVMEKKLCEQGRKCKKQHNEQMLQHAKELSLMKCSYEKQLEQQREIISDLLKKQSNLKAALTKK